MSHKDSLVVTSDPPSGLPWDLWAALQLDMLPVAGTDSLDWHTRLCHTCSFDHWGLWSFPLALDNLVLNILTMRDRPIRSGTPVVVGMQHLADNR